MRKVTIVVLILSFIVFCTGCEAFKLRKDYSKVQEVKTPRGPFATYLEDRVLDFMDWFPGPFGMRLSMGPGLLVHGQATKFAQGGVGFFDGDKVGFHGREVGYWHEWRGEVGVSVFYINTSKKDILIGNRFLFEAARKAEAESITDIDVFRNDDRDLWDFSVSVHALFFGFDIEFRTREFADFLFGLVTLDMQKDDTKNRLRKAAGTQEPTAPVRARAPETVPSPSAMPRSGEGKY